MNVTVTQMTSNGTDTMTVGWAKDTDAVGAMLSVAQLIQHSQDDSPWAPKILEITITL